MHFRNFRAFILSALQTLLSFKGCIWTPASYKKPSNIPCLAGAVSDYLLPCCDLTKIANVFPPRMVNTDTSFIVWNDIIGQALRHDIELSSLPKRRGFVAVLDVEVKEVVTLTFEREQSVGPQPNIAVHSRGEVEAKERQRWVGNLNIIDLLTLWLTCKRCSMLLV